MKCASSIVKDDAEEAIKEYAPEMEVKLDDVTEKVPDRISNKGLARLDDCSVGAWKLRRIKSVLPSSCRRNPEVSNVNSILETENLELVLCKVMSSLKGIVTLKASLILSAVIAVYPSIVSESTPFQHSDV